MSTGSVELGVCARVNRRNFADPREREKTKREREREREKKQRGKMGVSKREGEAERQVIRGAAVEADFWKQWEAVRFV